MALQVCLIHLVYYFQFLQIPTQVDSCKKEKIYSFIQKYLKIHLYIYKRCVCLFVCLFVWIWRPNYWSDLDQIWHGPPPGPCCTLGILFQS